jgi:hypothetical protein
LAGDVRRNGLNDAAVLKTLGVTRARELYLSAHEEQHILRVLKACGGVRSAAARLLGIPRRTLQRKLAEIPRRKKAEIKPPAGIRKRRRKSADSTISGEHVLALRALDMTWQQIATVLRCTQLGARAAAKRAGRL